MPSAARVGDMHICPVVSPLPHVGGPILPSANVTVSINQKLAATVGSPAACLTGPPDVVTLGSTKVFIKGLPAARVGDLCAHGGNISTGSLNVFIGG